MAATYAGAVCWVLWAGFVETALFAWGIGNSQQLSASAWCWVMLATRLSEQEEHWGAAAPKLRFLPSPHSLLEKLWQFPPFPSSPQLLLGVPPACPVCVSSAEPKSHIPPVAAVHSQALQEQPVPVSLCSYRALHLCSSFPNVFLCLLFSGAFAFSREGAMLFQPSSFSFLPWCLPWCSYHVSSNSFIAGHLCPVTPACKPGPETTVEK